MKIEFETVVKSQRQQNQQKTNQQTNKQKTKQPPKENNNNNNNKQTNKQKPRKQNSNQNLFFALILILNIQLYYYAWNIVLFQFGWESEQVWFRSNIKRL